MILKIQGYGMDYDWWLYDNLCKVRHFQITLERKNLDKYIEGHNAFMYMIPEAESDWSGDSNVVILTTVIARQAHDDQEVVFIVSTRMFLMTDEGKTIDCLN
ncbi:MAG TPA: hypothetical protein ENI23_01265 [bacterium]|nr:hypothetical protein [bacterium]